MLRIEKKLNGGEGMKPELIFYSFYSLVVVFIFLFINAVIIIVYYKASTIVNKKEVFKDILFSLHKNNDDLSPQDSFVGERKASVEAFRNNTFLMTRVLYILLAVFVALFILTMLVIGIVKRGISSL